MSALEGATLVGVVGHALIVVVAAVLISRNRHPSSAIAWTLAIVLIPALGIVAFLLIGFGRLPKRRRDDQHDINELMLARTPSLHQVIDPRHPSLGAAARLGHALGALPMLGDNSVELLDDYDDSIRTMAAAIDTAKHTVHVEFYIFVLDNTTDVFFDAMARAVSRGVRVCVLYDDIGALLQAKRRKTRGRLRDMGAESHTMLPVRPWRGQWQRPDLRNHRKLVVLDGLVAFTGSQNLIDATYLKRRNAACGRRWKELMIRIEGPAVREVDAVFITDWYSETRELLPLDTSPVIVGARGLSDNQRIDAQVLPSGPSFENDNNLKVFTFLLHQARQRITVTSPYFVPDDAVMLALITAASRGVIVELFVSAIGDQALVHHAQRSYYEALLRAGVRIWLYRAPAVLHSKHFSIDDDIAVIGSSNLDIRSFSLNMEISVLLHNRELVSELRVVQEQYREVSDELTLDEWLRRPRRHRILDDLARLTSALQ